MTTKRDKEIIAGINNYIDRLNTEWSLAIEKGDHLGSEFIRGKMQGLAEIRDLIEGGH